MMPGRAPLALLLLALPAAAQQPWEVPVDLPVPVPVELPAIVATNPFAADLAAQPVLLTSPLAEELEGTFRTRAAVYIDAAGTVRRVVFVHLPLSSVAPAVRAAIEDTEFAPARFLGTAAPVWIDLGVDLQGTIEGGRVLQVRAVAPDPSTPPLAEAEAVPTPEARDVALPATPVEHLDQAPAPKRFRARVSSQEWRQEFRLLAEVSPAGRCSRVVFLACPEGLRPWLLASSAAWTFRPGRDAGGPVTAWTEVSGAVEVEVGTLRSEALRVIRERSYPR